MECTAKLAKNAKNRKDYPQISQIPLRFPPSGNRQSKI
jgi:hypothetical protein